MQGTSGYQRMLLEHGINQEGQAPDNAGISSVPGPMAEPQEDADPFTGKGELLEATDAEAFKAIDALVKAQEPLARNRLNIDKHYTATKLGYIGSTLIKVENQDQWQQSYLPGTRDRLQSGAIPNKQAELCQKLTETLLVDPPKLDPTAEDDDETAMRGAELAREYLHHDATEAGTDDLTLWAYQIEAATTRGAVFNHYWVDPTGGGSIPQQIKAHPDATDPANPLVAVDPMTGQELPTTDYVLRYVTEDGQFTDSPSDAARTWVPRQRIDTLAREHVRFYPQTADLHAAHACTVIYYCTVEEARRRWPETVGQMDDAQLLALVGWTPLRPLAILPAALRPIWRQGRADTGKATRASDQQIVFFYAHYMLASPEYPEGAMLWVNGANGGTVFGRDVLTATVEIPSQRQQDQTVTDRKDLDLPLAQLRLLPDTDDRDPLGRPFMERVAGAGEAGATLATAMLDAIDQVLHPVRYSIGTSSVDEDAVDNARATGAFVPVLNRDEVPQLEERRDLPGAYFAFTDWLYSQMDSSAGLRPPDRANEAKVKSGVALRIEVEEATKTLTRMNYAVHAAWARHGRIKLQQAMKYFSVPQLLRYVGVDGAAKQEWFTGNDFARVGSVAIATGSGTMLPPGEKVNLAIQLQGAGQMDADEAAEIARPAFQKQLGTTPNPHVQRIERQVSSWLEGPPEGWEEQAAQYQQQVLAHAELTKQVMLSNPMATEADLPPQPPAPWTPFAVEVMDGEPPIATIRKRRLATLMAKVEFSKHPEPWKQVCRDAYTHAVNALQAVALAQQPQAAQPAQSATLDVSAESPQNAMAQPPQ